VDDFIDVRKIESRQRAARRGREFPQHDEPDAGCDPKRNRPKNCEPLFQEREYNYGVAHNSKHFILGVEGGATKTDWRLCESGAEGTKIVSEGRLGPGSMKLLDPTGLRHLLSVLPREVDRAGIFLAGCATEQDRKALFQLAAEIWPQAALAVGSDRESGFAACFEDQDGIAVIAGTGSAITGRKGGQEERAGGWGHLLGDTGGGYDLAIHGLRQVLYDFDTEREITQLGADTLRVLGLNTLRELTTWAQNAHKSDLARLTPLLFDHIENPKIAQLLQAGAHALARLTISVAKRLDFQPPTIRLTGSVFTKQPSYQNWFRDEVCREWPAADVAVCGEAGSAGAIFLAASVSSPPAEAALPADEAQLAEATTEQSNPRSQNLDQLGTHQLVQLFVDEEKYVQAALAGSTEGLVLAVEAISKALGQNGRLFYVGAGTSGRLGVLDASEMPPTFGVEPDLVQAIMAGGAAALQRSAEGVEDSGEAGAQAILDRGVTARDIVCGLTASGRTPFVLEALKSAKFNGAGTILLTCNPHRDRTVRRAEIEIDLATGPEIITGSTRLKAGTATKVALNIISSCSMVRLGRVDGNFMSCLRASNDKLRDRAMRIVAARLEIPLHDAKRHLEWANWNIRAAIDEHQNGASKDRDALNHSHPRD